MKNITFVIENGSVDTNGDKLVVEGLKIPKTIRMVKDFDSGQPVADISLTNEGGQIKGYGEIRDEYLDLYPAVGFKILEAEEKDGIRIIKAAELHYVSLSAHPNVDRLIKTLREQLNPGE